MSLGIAQTAQGLQTLIGMKRKFIATKREKKRPEYEITTQETALEILESALNIIQPMALRQTNGQNR